MSKKDRVGELKDRNVIIFITVRKVTREQLEEHDRKKVELKDRMTMRKETRKARTW